MHDKAIDNYFHSLEFVSDCYKSQKMCDKTVNNSFPDQYKIQEICDKVLPKNVLFLDITLIDIRLKKYVITLLCLPTLKYVSFSFVANNMLEKLYSRIVE